MRGGAVTSKWTGEYDWNAADAAGGRALRPARRPRRLNWWAVAAWIIWPVFVWGGLVAFVEGWL